MEYKIISPERKIDFDELFQGKKVSNDIYTIEKMIDCQEKFVTMKRKLSKEVLSTLEFIEILIDFYTPSQNKYITESGFAKISAGELIHLDTITNTQIFDDYKKYEGIYVEKHIKQYYNEVFSIIKQNNPFRALNEKFNALIEVISKFKGFNDRFEEYVVNFLDINNIIIIEREKASEVELDFYLLVEQIKNKINPIYIELAKDLEIYISGIDPITLSWIIEQHKLPPFWEETKKLKMKNDAKVDIVRFADFFGIGLSHINKIFTPKVVTHDRNKVSNGGIFRKLNKYPTLRKKTLPKS